MKESGSQEPESYAGFILEYCRETCRRRSRRPRQRTSFSSSFLQLIMCESVKTHQSDRILRIP